MENIYLTDSLLDLFNLQDKRIYLDLEKAKHTLDGYHNARTEIYNSPDRSNDCSEFKPFYNNLSWKRHLNFPTLCLDLVYKGFYIPLNCFYIKINIES